MTARLRIRRGRFPQHRVPQRQGVASALGLALGPAVALGLARFAYALLLPSMRVNLHWSFATAGALNTANAVGYLLGALLGAPIARRWGTRRAFISSLAVTVLSLLGTGAADTTGLLVVARTIAGASGAVTFITGAGLVAQATRAGSSRRAATLLGIYFAGAGVGIVVSGLAIPRLLAATSPAEGWRWAWVLLAALGAVALAVAVPAALASAEPPLPPAAQRRWPVRSLAPLLVSYGLFGVGYIAYMTFIIAFLRARGAVSGEIAAFWVVLGVASIAGAFAWARPISSLVGGRGTAAVLGVLSVGALLPLVSRSPVAAIGSALLFGGSFLSVLTGVTTVARRSLPSHHWTPAIAGLTVVFAAGQGIGPILAGVLSDGPGGLTLGLDVSVVILAAASLIAVAQPHRERPTASVAASTDVSIGS